MASNGTTTTATNGSGGPEIILYTNHGCPWAHRAHIALKELGLSYKEVIIDLDRPREPWYLEINPVCGYHLALQDSRSLVYTYAYIYLFYQYQLIMLLSL